MQICTLGTLSKILQPCRQLAILDLGYARWETSPVSGLKALVQISNLKSLAFAESPSPLCFSHALPLLERLTALRLHSSRPPLAVVEASQLTACINLASLSMPSLEKDSRLPTLLAACSLSGLKHLNLEIGQHAFPSHVSFQQLISLELESSFESPSFSLDFLQQMCSLTSLKLRNSSRLHDLEPLAGLSASLKLLFIDDASGLESLHSLSLLVSLIDLSMMELPHDIGLDPISCLTRLTRLYFLWDDGIPYLLDVSPLSQLVTLHELKLDFFYYDADSVPILGISNLLSQLPSFSNLSRLSIPIDSDDLLGPLVMVSKLYLINIGGATEGIISKLPAWTFLLVELQLDHFTFTPGPLRSLGAIQGLVNLTLEMCTFTCPGVFDDLCSGGAHLTHLRMIYCNGLRSCMVHILRREGLELEVELDEDDDDYNSDGDDDGLTLKVRRP